MDSYQRLTTRRAQILEEISGLGPMRKGSVCQQELPYKRSDGSVGHRGPYWTYSFKEGGKTHSKHLREAEEAQLYERQIQSFRRYQKLSAELVRINQSLADLEATGDEGCKKNSRA